ncbi:MAG: hypothetical protein ABEI13_01945 [Candidatus Paceibacteria bacterium]
MENDINIERTTAQEMEFEIGSEKFDEFEEFVIDSMNYWCTEIDKSFVQSVQEAEYRHLNKDLSKKGKRVYIGHKSEKIRSIVIASKKRGGSIEISPFLTNSMGSSIDQFLDFVEKDLSEVFEFRKLYTFVPRLDHELLEFFLQNGYNPEGLLREPYRKGINMVFLGKLNK